MVSPANNNKKSQSHDAQVSLGLQEQYNGSARLLQLMSAQNALYPANIRTAGTLRDHSTS